LNPHIAMLKFVLSEEKKLAEKFKERKYTFETKGRQTVKVYTREYSKAFHKILDGMVERQMRASIKLIGDFWFTAWVDAGQPDMKSLIDYKPSEDELLKRRQEVEEWKNRRVKSRDHEQDS
jgi:hypothetical protein